MVKKIREQKWFLTLVVAVLILVPTIYSIVFLRAYWDPYGQMRNLPVAIVNEDRGKNGENKGSELVQKIGNKAILNLKKEKLSEAEKKLKSGEIYAIIKIPQNFTASLYSANETEKIQAEIDYLPNQKANFVVSQLLRMVTGEIKQQVNSEASQKIVVSLVEKLNSVPDEMEKMRSGIGELANGARKLQNSYGEFHNGMQKLNSGTEQLNSGINQLNSGAQQLRTSAAALNAGSEQIGALSDGISALKTGSENYTTGVKNYINLTKIFTAKFNGNLDKNFAIIKTVACANPATQDCATINALLAQISKILGKDAREIANLTPNQVLNLLSNSLINGGENLNQGMQEIATAADQFPTLQKNLVALAAGIDRFSVASDQVANGANQIKNSTNALSAASNQIAGGIGELANGLDFAEKKVHDSIKDSKKELQKLDGLAHFSAEPAKINERPVEQVATYGMAFIPFFVSLSLWVGAFVLFVVLYNDRDQRFKNYDFAAKNRVKRTALYIGAAIAQGLVLGVILKLFLGFPVTNWWLYFGSLILVSAMFEAIIEFLIVVLGDFGRFLALILLIVQVAASGGTFPIETVANEFQWLYNLLPMRYSIGLFKEATVSINSGILLPTIILISAITLIFIAANFTVSAFRDRKNQ